MSLIVQQHVFFDASSRIRSHASFGISEVCSMLLHPWGSSAAVGKKAPLYGETEFGSFGMLQMPFRSGHYYSRSALVSWGPEMR